MVASPSPSPASDTFFGWAEGGRGRGLSLFFFCPCFKPSNSPRFQGQKGIEDRSMGIAYVRYVAEEESRKCKDPIRNVPPKNNTEQVVLKGRFFIFSYILSRVERSRLRRFSP